MRWKHIIEAPIADLVTTGDLDNEGSFTGGDFKAIRNPKWETKVWSMFEKCPVPINLYLYNAPGGMAPIGPDGKEIKANDLRANRYHGTLAPSEFKRLVGTMPTNYSKAVNILFLHNEGDEKVPLTPWMVGHRIIHAIMYAGQDDNNAYSLIAERHTQLFRAFQSFYNSARSYLRGSDHNHEFAGTSVDSTKEMKAVARIMCTMRSAREGMVRDHGELLVELCVEWLVQGSVRFNRPVLDSNGRKEQLPETPLLKAAREFYDSHWYSSESGEAFADHYIKTAYLPPIPGYVGYLAIDPKTKQTIASFGQDKVQHYTDRGFEIIQRDAAKEQKQYDSYVKRRAKIAAQYDAWNAARELRSKEERQTQTDRLDSLMDFSTLHLNEAIERYIQAAVGKFYLL